MLEGQSQALIQPLTLLQGNPTLVQQQRPIKAVSASCGAHLAWRGMTDYIKRNERINSHTLKATSDKNMLTYQELGHVKGQILDKAEPVLS